MFKNLPPCMHSSPKPSEEPEFDLYLIKKEVRLGATACLERHLHSTSKWLTELNRSLEDTRIGAGRPSLTEFEKECELDDFLMASSYFGLKEFDRCAFFLKDYKTPLSRFMYYYARYMSSEQKRSNDITEATVSYDSPQTRYMRQLAADLRVEYHNEGMDGFLSYVYGVVLKKMELLNEAEDMLVEAIGKVPMHWGAWLELAPLVQNKRSLLMLDLPDHWMRHFFYGFVYLELQLYVEAAEVFGYLQQNGFGKSTFVFVQTAMISHNKRDVDKAIDLFRRLQVEDPYRLDNLDTFSNLLYVKELRVELAHLAHQATEIDKYKVETCCVIGNYYSLRSEHQKAVVYFQRALKLNPLYLAAWTLMGHEFMEMKNTNAAIQSYRQAIEVNRRDYRAWYGLGQTYEILKMMFYCLYYYKHAQMLRPNDSRMLVALGETYEKLERYHDAHKCYFKARTLGDIDASALVKLAKLYEKLGDDDQAATAYTEYVGEIECRPYFDPSDHCSAFKYLANYYVKRNLDLAYSYAQQCLEYEETKEEGKALLRTISQRRSQSETIDDMLQEEPFSPSSMTTCSLSRDSNDSLQTTNFSPVSDSSGPMNLSFNMSSSTSD